MTVRTARTAAKPRKGIANVSGIKDSIKFQTTRRDMKNSYLKIILRTAEITKRPPAR